MSKVDQKLDELLDIKGEIVRAEKNLPTVNITLDTNVAKLSSDLISKMRLAPNLISKIESFELKASKLRKKRLY